MAETLHIVGISGSLRKGSYNTALLHAAKSMAPAGMKIEIAEIGDLPLYNQDLDAALPEPVVRLKKQIEAADGVLIATPEHNYSISGVLKNALDWASRPYGQNSFDEKPVAIMGASVGMGTVRAQYHLRQMFVHLNGLVLNRPEVMVPQAGDKFDEQGNITDEKTKQKVVELLTALQVWVERLRK